jgi:putative intracellular protease/amidase
MKHFHGFIGFLVFCAAMSYACTPGQRQAAKTVLDLAQTLCIVAHAESDDATVAQVCGITEALLPDMRKLVSEQRKAASKHVGSCK